MTMNRKAFRNPPADCRAAPFWSWNGNLDPAETRRQVRDMADHGMGGAFLHARGGLRTEYLGTDWFANVSASVAEGKNIGFSSWLYDEDCWPSGSCSGKTASAHPDFCSRVLVYRRGQGTLEPKDFGVPVSEMECLACFKTGAEQAATPTFKPVAKRHAGSPGTLTFYSSTLGRIEVGREHYPDLMHPPAIREFIRNTHARYARHVGREFGKSIPGVFTDEPTLSPELPWSIRFPAEFRKRRGYDLLRKLPHLIFATTESPTVRHDYWKTVSELTVRSYSGQLGAWCARHKLLFTGHFFAEGGLGSQVRSNGGCMPHYAHMGVPGIDHLCEQIDEVLTVRQCTSVANQFGMDRVLSELYGATGYNFSFEAQKWAGDWQMAKGINLLCQHLTHYTMKGGAKRDYPPSYGYQSPWWRHYRHMADYQARLTYALRQGRPVRDILVIHPLTSAWTLMGAVASTHGVALIEQPFKALLKRLPDMHRDYDLGDETLMAKHGRVQGRALRVGQAAYRVVIVPGMVNLESSTLKLLESFQKAGGCLVFLPPVPIRADGMMSDRAKKLALATGAKCVSDSGRELEEALDSALPRSVSVAHCETGAEAADVLLMERRSARDTLLFVANTRRDIAQPLCVRLRGRGTWRQWNCETGTVHPVPSTQAGGWSKLTLTLPPAGSAVLVRSPGHPIASNKAPGRRTSMRVLDPRKGWAFRRMAPNSLILDRCTWRLGDESFEPAFLMSAQAAWRRRLNIGTADYQPWKLLKNPDNLRTLATVTLRFTLTVNEIPSREVRLALEDRDLTHILVNGARVDAPSDGWFMDKAFETVPIGALLRTGQNIIEVRVPICAARSVEEMYVTGDFGVDSSTFALVREPRRLAVGDWCAQGYPFYTDAMMYLAKFDAPQKGADRTIVEFDRFEGTVAAVWVNGQKAAVIGWHPYQADVTKFVRAGSNELGIEIVGSPRNLMGPRHHARKYPSWTGPGELADMSQPAYHLTPAGLTGEVRIVQE